MDITLADWIAIIGLLVGVFGAAAAIWEAMRVRSARRMFREQCETRLKDLVQAVSQLGASTNSACQIKDEHFDDLMIGHCEPQKSIRHLRELSDQIHAISVSRNQLERFCERLNDEHKEEFGTPVFKSILKEFPELPAGLREPTYTPASHPTSDSHATT
jgi:hypothetical protein